MQTGEPPWLEGVEGKGSPLQPVRLNSAASLVGDDEKPILITVLIDADGRRRTIAISVPFALELMVNLSKFVRQVGVDHG